jgi:superfamily II DNA or RNA helicase
MNAKTIELGNVWSRASEPTAEIAAVIRELEGEIPDGRYSLRSSDGHFLSGVVDTVAARTGRRIVDCRTPPRAIFSPLYPELRDYQARAVQAAIAFSRGLVELPTGSGKTRVAAALTAAVPIRWLYVVHRSNLVEQTATTMEKVLGEPVGKIAAGTHTIERVTCATYQSLLRSMGAQSRGAWWEVEGVIGDEVHRAPADGPFEILTGLENAYYRIGLSATPLARGDGANVLTIGLFGPRIFGVSARPLIERGYLAQGKVSWTRIVHPGVGGTWHEVYRELIVDNEERNRTLIELALRARPPVLMLVTEVLHGLQLYEALTAARGSKVAFVDGSSNAAERLERVRAARNGEVEIIVATSVFDEGVDLPELRSVVVGSAGKSVIRAVQQLGRGTRPAAEKDGFTLYDIADVGQSWLEKHTEERYLAYKGTGYAVDEPPRTAERIQRRTQVAMRKGVGESYGAGVAGDDQDWVRFLGSLGMVIILLLFALSAFF